MTHKETVEQYCKDIKSKKILSGMYAKKAVDRFLKDIQKSKTDTTFQYTLDTDRADEVIDFAETLTIPDIDKDDGKLQLLPWMKFVYYNLFGWVKKDDPTVRRFRSGYIEVARKNSKTTSLLFPLILWDFLSTDSAESYFVSKDNGQSEKSYKELKHIIKADPALSKVTESTVSAITLEHSRIAFFSSDSGGIDSYKNSFSVIDEFHSYDNDRVVTAFRYGGRARKNNLVLIITSAGLDISLPCYAENQKSKSILNGLYTDDTYFALIYAYDEDDDWQDPRLFIKANPSLHAILKQEILENDLTDAQITPSHQADFKSKTCGIWSNGTSSWIPLQKWQSHGITYIDENRLLGQRAFAAFDLSSVSDFTAYTLCFFIDNQYVMKHRFFIPEETAGEKYKKDNINLYEWIQNGLVTTTPGQTVDYDFLFKAFSDDVQKYTIVNTSYDPWSSKELITQCDDTFPKIDFIEFQQNLRSMSVPTKEYERAILNGNVIDPNPVMLWMISNVKIKVDQNDNYKPLKENASSTKRIDGVITSIMAHSRCAEYYKKPVIKPGDFDSILKSF